MADILYDSGLDDWKDWATGGAFSWLLLNAAHVPDRTIQYISDLPAGSELTTSGYARQTAASMTRSVDTALHRITYDCGDPSFGPLQTGATVGFVLLARKTGADNTSRLLALYQIAAYSTDGSVLSPAISANGVHYVMQAP